MIISTFKTGQGKSRGPINYLLGNDKDNKPRNPKPEILKGDKKLTEVLIDSNHRKYKYTSGVIAFRDNEKPTQEQIEKIINAFEKTFTPELQERVPLLWVKHEDKGNTELHFICPMQDSKTGKQFNICPPGEQFKQMFKDFQAVANDSFGWEQVRPNLLKAELTALEKISIKDDPDKLENNSSPTLKNAKIKTTITEQIVAKVEKGELKNRNQLIEHLKKIGFEITRKAKDYISIKHQKALKATRLKGPAFAENANYFELLNQSALPQKLSDFEKEEVKKRLDRAIKNRKRSLLEQLDNVPKQPQQPQEIELLVDDSGGDGGSSGGDISISINKELMKQQQSSTDLPQISSLPVRKFKAG